MQNNSNIFQAAADMILKYQQRPLNPDEQAGLDAIISGDSVKGEQIAREICEKKLGMSPQEAYAQACRFLGL